MIGLPTTRDLEDLGALDPGLPRGLADQRVHRGAHARVSSVRRRDSSSRRRRGSSDPRRSGSAGSSRRARRRPRRVSRSQRCAAIVVEPMSNATPKARSAKPGVTATISRPLRSATVTFHSPARSAFCRPRSTGRLALRLAEAPLLGQRLLQAPQIARGIVHVGLGDLDIMQAHDRIDLDRMRLRALAHDLAMHLAFRRARRRRDRRRSAPGSRAGGPAGSAPRLSA